MFRALKKLRQNRAIRRAYGTSHPETARVPGGPHEICVDATDLRARKILLFDTVRGRSRPNQTFWYLASQVFQPTVCLDVGLNYGECLLAGESPAGAELHGFEANTRLRPFIDKTLASHPHADRIQVHYGAASDRAGDTVVLAVDPTWSGRSHIASSASAMRACDLGVEVQTLTIDQTVSRPTKETRLLFKIDVEGHEAAVLRGMEQTLSSAGSAVGFIEFNKDMLTERGTDLSLFWSALREHFDVFYCKGPQMAQPVMASDWDQAKLSIPENGDLILMSRPISAAQKRLLDRWRQPREGNRRAA